MLDVLKVHALPNCYLTVSCRSQFALGDLFRNAGLHVQIKYTYCGIHKIGKHINDVVDISHYFERQIPDEHK